MGLKYRIGSIGWYNFETLVQTLLKGLIGPGVTSFGGTKDDGRDASFSGAASFPSEDTQWDGYSVFQVKHIDFEQQGVRTARTQLKNAFTQECKSILTRRKAERWPDNYVLITDVPLTSLNRGDLTKIIGDAGFAGNFGALDGKEVCEFLDLYPQVRRSYPQLLGLADLDQIVNRELYTRSIAYVEQWQPQLMTFVRTEAYLEALSKLRGHRFIVLDGPPEAGKSTIAAALALLYAADGFEVVDIRQPTDFFRAYSADRSQLFVADDAVGSLDFDPSLTGDWSRDLPGVLRKLDGRHLLVWTTRSYVLEHAMARSRLGETLEDFPGVHEVLVEAGTLSQLEKAEILYNHCKHAGLSQEARAVVREHAQRIVNHSSFTPERIRQLVHNVLQDGASGAKRPRTIRWSHIDEFLKDPKTRWAMAYTAVTESEQTLLRAMLDFGDRALSREVGRAFQLRCMRLKGRHLSFEECLKRLDHSFLHVVSSFEGMRYVDFQHPSLRDMLLAQLREDEKGRRRFIELASPLGLANLIQGMGQRASDGPDEIHVLSPMTPEDESILIARLSGLSTAVLHWEEWHRILYAARLLLPRDSSQQRVPPAEVDLTGFASSSAGRTIEAVVHAFAAAETFDNMVQCGIPLWTKLLENYYQLAMYVVPPPRPTFLRDLLQALPETPLEQAVEMASLVGSRDPLLLAQSLPDRLFWSWDEDLRYRLEELVGAGEAFLRHKGHEDWTPEYSALAAAHLGEYEEYWYWAEYDEWYSNGSSLVDVAREFYAWADFDAPDDLERLEELLLDVAGPGEPDYEPEPHALWSGSPAEYWTIETMFEDL